MTVHVVAAQLGRLAGRVEVDAISVHVWDWAPEGRRERDAGRFGRQVGETRPITPDMTWASVPIPLEFPGGHLHPVLWHGGEPVVYFGPETVMGGDKLGAGPLPIAISMTH